MGISHDSQIAGTNHPAYQVSKNPWNEDHVIGDGSAAAPSIAPASEPTTGLSFAAGATSFSILGVERLSLSATELLVSTSVSVKGPKPWATLLAYCTGDGSTDDTAGLVAAFAAADNVLAPDPSVNYKLSSAKVTLAANKRLIGVGKHTTKFLHAYNGDMFELGNGARLENLYLEGQGATFTGKGVVMTGSNGKQAIHHCKIIDFDSACIDFAVAAGSQFSGFDIETYRTSSGTGTGRYAIVISPTQQLSAVPRAFSQIQTGGNCSFGFGGCNNVYISDSFLADLLYTADTRAAFISNTRIANAATLTIVGHGNTIVGGDISPAVTIAAGSFGNVVGPCAFNSPPVVDNSGNLTNQIFDYVHAQVGYLKLMAAASKIVPGTTSLSLRNNADGADNLLMTDAGIATFRGTVIVPNNIYFSGKDSGGTQRALLGLAGDNTLSIGTISTPNTNGHVIFYVNGVEQGRITPSGSWRITPTLEIDGILDHDGASVGFYGVAPVTRPTAYTQTYATADKTHAADGSADLATTAATQTTPWGFASAAQADNIATQLNLLRATVTDLKQLVNSIIDDGQSLGLLQ